VYIRTIEQGNLLRWYGINADIDDRKRPEQKLQADERDLRAITETIRQPVEFPGAWPHFRTFRRGCEAEDSAADVRIENPTFEN
jgi:hypothetical protein